MLSSFAVYKAHGKQGNIFWQRFLSNASMGHFSNNQQPQRAGNMVLGWKYRIPVKCLSPLFEDK